MVINNYKIYDLLLYLLNKLSIKNIYTIIITKHYSFVIFLLLLSIKNILFYSNDKTIFCLPCRNCDDEARSRKSSEPYTSLSKGSGLLQRSNSRNKKMVSMILTPDKM